MLIGLAAALIPAVAAAGWHSEAANKMGTRVSVRLWHDDAAAAQRASTAVLTEFDRIENLMSTYVVDSRMSVINRDAATRPVDAGEELFNLIERSWHLSELSGGAFDITYDSVGRHYDFRARVRPSEATIATEIERIDYRLLELDRGECTVRFLADGVRINLGGIAKGYAVERAIAVLRQHGVTSGLVTAGGDTRLLGDRQGAPWIVGVQNPRDDGEVAVRLPLVDEAVSTSGDYERFFEQAGTRFHHIISPDSGRPAAGVRSATVIGPDGVMTDGLSTAVFVLGPEKGIALLSQLPGYEGLVIDNRQNVHFSEGLAPPAVE